MGHDNALNALIELPRYLGGPNRDYAILGEGDTPVRMGALFSQHAAIERNKQ